MFRKLLVFAVGTSVGTFAGLLLGWTGHIIYNIWEDYTKSHREINTICSDSYYQYNEVKEWYERTERKNKKHILTCYGYDKNGRTKYQYYVKNGELRCNSDEVLVGRVCVIFYDAMDTALLHGSKYKDLKCTILHKLQPYIGGLSRTIWENIGKIAHVADNISENDCIGYRGWYTYVGIIHGDTEIIVDSYGDVSCSRPFSDIVGYLCTILKVKYSGPGDCFNFAGKFPGFPGSPPAIPGGCPCNLPRLRAFSFHFAIKSPALKGLKNVKTDMRNLCDCFRGIFPGNIHISPG